MLTRPKSTRKETNMQKSRMILFTLISTFSLLCGCSAAPTSATVETPNPAVADDNPANHGPLAIMETEYGYYYNYNRTHYAEEHYHNNYTVKHTLQYYDKETQEHILLCNKPECEHNGSSTCAATYKNLSVINSLLYDNYIYVYATEINQNLISMNLYRIALDGSSLDKVGTVLETENTIGEGISAIKGKEYGIAEGFIIHRGYAYLPYYLRIGKASKGFMGGGLVQMNLETGETKTIHEMPSMIASYPYNLRAYGDYVYVDLTSTRRYVISEDRLEYPPAFEAIKNKPQIHMITPTRLYTIAATKDAETKTYHAPIFITAYDAATGELVPEEGFDTDITYEEFKKLMISFSYEDMLVVVTGNRVIFYDSSPENVGAKLGEIAVDYTLPEMEMHAVFFDKNIDFKITNDTLYCIRNPQDTYEYKAFANIEPYRTYEVLKCPVKDILAGTGSWEKAFEQIP